MKVTFSSTHSAWSVKAPKGTLVSLTATPTEAGDGVYNIGDEGYILIDDQTLTDSIYLSTSGEDYTVTGGARVCYPAAGVEVRAGSSVLPFKQKSKGGDSGGGSLPYTSEILDGDDGLYIVFQNKKSVENTVSVYINNVFLRSVPLKAYKTNYPYVIDGVTKQVGSYGWFPMFVNGKKGDKISLIPSGNLGDVITYTQSIRKADYADVSVGVGFSLVVYDNRTVNGIIGRLKDGTSDTTHVTEMSSTPTTPTVTLNGQSLLNIGAYRDRENLESYNYPLIDADQAELGGVIASLKADFGIQS